jgi:hypothetical protein
MPLLTQMLVVKAKLVLVEQVFRAAKLIMTNYLI